jgi:hypothetical protein
MSRAAPGRHRPEADGLRQATDRPQGRPVSGLSPKQAAVPSGAEPGHEQSGGLFVPGEEPGGNARRGLQSRPRYSADERQT